MTTNEEKQGDMKIKYLYDKKRTSVNNERSSSST